MSLGLLLDSKQKLRKGREEYGGAAASVHGDAGAGLVKPSKKKSFFSYNAYGLMIFRVNSTNDA